MVRKSLSLVFIAVSVSLAWPPAGAEALTGGDAHNRRGLIRIHSGIGRYNKSYASVLSPTVNRGFQQVSNTNVSGKTTTMVGICAKKYRICRISQRFR